MSSMETDAGSVVTELVLGDVPLVAEAFARRFDANAVASLCEHVGGEHIFGIGGFRDCHLVAAFC